MEWEEGWTIEIDEQGTLYFQRKHGTSRPVACNGCDGKIEDDNTYYCHTQGSSRTEMRGKTAHKYIVSDQRPLLNGFRQNHVAETATTMSSCNLSCYVMWWCSDHCRWRCDRFFQSDLWNGVGWSIAAHPGPTFTNSSNLLFQWPAWCCSCCFHFDSRSLTSHAAPSGSLRKVSISVVPCANRTTRWHLHMTRLCGTITTGDRFEGA